MNLKLKFRIIERYGTQSRFAMACNRNDNWISRIITGRQAPSEIEKQLIAKLLEIEDIDYYLSNGK